MQNEMKNQERIISCFKGTRPVAVNQTTLSALLEGIQGEKYQEEITQLRTLREQGKTPEYEKLKRQLPAVTISGTFQKRAAQSLIQHSGLLQLDMDHVKNPEAVRDQIIQDPHILAAFLSPSGDGVKGIMKISNDPKQHKESFKAAERHMKQNYKITLDSSCSDVSRLMFVSYDPNLRSNPQASELKILPKKDTDFFFDATQVKEETPLSDFEQAEAALKFISPECEYKTWVEIGMALKEGFGGSGFSLWDSWSSGGSKYKAPEMQSKWNSFSGGSIQINTLFHHAKSGGYVREAKEMLLPSSKEKTGTQTVSPSDPSPEEIQIKLPSVAKVSSKMIPKEFRLWVEDIADRLKIPVDFLIVPLVVVAGSLIGTGCKMRPKQYDDWEVTPNLWGGIIGPPSVMKSPALKEVVSNPLGRLEAKAIKAQKENSSDHSVNQDSTRDEMKIVRNDLKEAIKQRRRKEQAKTEEEKGGFKEIPSVEEEEGEQQTQEDTPELKLKNELKELSQKLEPLPTERRFKTNDCTIEKMVELLQKNPRGLLYFRDELIGLFRRMEKSGNEQDRAFLLEAWNGNHTHTDDRIGRGTIRAENLCISLFGGIQPDKILFYLKRAIRDHDNDGFVQRLQMFIYPDLVDWNYEDKFPNSSAKREAFTLLEKLSEMNFSAFADKDEFKESYFLRFSKEGQKVFKQWLTQLETQKLRNNEDHSILIEHWAKYRSLMPSLALIFHLIEIAEGAEPSPVCERCASMAAAWCQYLEGHARRIYHLATDSALILAGKLTQKIEKKKLKSPFKRHQIISKGWEGFHDKEEVQSVLDILQDKHWIFEVKSLGKTITHRPQATEYRINDKFESK